MIYTVTLNPTIDRTMHFPTLKVGELNRASHSRIDLSGKGVNVSVALRRFGVETVVMGLAAGVSGRVLVTGLQDLGYICDFVEIAGETRSNITVIDEAHGVTTKLNEPGPTIREEDLAALEERLVARLGIGDLCVFSGSLPPGAPSETYARLIAAVKGRSAQAVLDTSGRALALGCTAQPDLVKPNLVEAVELGALPGHLSESRRMAESSEGAAQLVNALMAIRALGPGRVLLSLGSSGAALADGCGAWWAVPPPVTEVSAVGAGDASMAAGLWAWSQGAPADEMVRWAVASGTATAMEDGTAIPTLARIQEVYTQVRVIHLDERKS